MAMMTWQEWSPAEVWCSTLMSHLFVTPAELRATASAMRTTLLHAPATYVLATDGGGGGVLGRFGHVDLLGRHP